MVVIVSSLWDGWSRIWFPAGTRGILFSTMARQVLGTMQFSIRWVMGISFVWVKWLGSKADHSPLSSAEVRNEWLYLCSIYTPSCGVKDTLVLLWEAPINFNMSIHPSICPFMCVNVSAWFPLDRSACNLILEAFMKICHTLNLVKKKVSYLHAGLSTFYWCWWHESAITALSSSEIVWGC
jgi:hypothetical protein